MTRYESIRWLLGTILMVLVWLMSPVLAEMAALFLIAVLGLPHGAADALLIKKRWPNIFGAAGIMTCYAAIAIAFAFFFFHFPALGLVVFILISIWHFGVEDSKTLPSWSIPAAGGIFILGPFLLWSAEINLYLSQLGLTDSQSVFLLRTAPWLFALCVVTLLLAVLRQLRVSKAPLIGFLLSIPVAIALPPLLGFSLYFSLLHAPRHSAFLTQHMPGWWRQPVVIFALLLTWVSVAVWLFYGGLSTVSERIAVAVIIGLAALTVPHMLLNAMIINSDSRIKVKHLS